MGIKLLTVFFSVLAVIQKISEQKDTTTYFFNKDFQATNTESNASYIGKAFSEGRYWRLIVTNRQTNKIVLKSFYSDAQLSQLENKYELFFDDGGQKTIGYYKNGVEDSTWKSWNERNLLIDSLVYKTGELLFREKMVYDSRGVVLSYQLIDNLSKRKIYKNYFGNGTLKDSAGWLGKQGEMRIYYPTSALAELIKYDETGKRVLWERYNENGAVITEKEYKKMINKQIEDLNQTIIANSPEYVGGQGQLNIFLQKNLKLPSGYLNIHQNQKIVFSFMLDEKGKAYDVVMIDPHDDELLHAVEDALRKMPPWSMKGNKSWGPIKQTINITY